MAIHLKRDIAAEFAVLGSDCLAESLWRILGYHLAARLQAELVKHELCYGKIIGTLADHHEMRGKLILTGATGIKRRKVA